MGEEADYLESQSDGGAVDDMRERAQQAYYDSLNRKEARYRDNKRSQVGTTIRCANCGRRIVKKSCQTQFCSNKSKGLIDLETSKQLLLAHGIIYGETILCDME